MNLDYTYIAIFGYPVFEPLILLTNSILFVLSVRFYRNLKSEKIVYSGNMALFILLLGLSAVFGAVVHTVHYQLGAAFFRTAFMMMNVTSFLSIYFCFRAALMYDNKLTPGKKRLSQVVFFWVLLMLVVCFVIGDFLLIKINAGVVIIYVLFVHLRAMRRHNGKGDKRVVTGLLISLLPILVHSLRLSLHKWFNYKDISHVLMIISLIVIYSGVQIIAGTSAVRKFQEV